MTAIDAALTANARSPVARAAFAAEPARRLVVLTCMDARLDPLRDLGLEVGDAHIVRNAGGRATDDALRSLLLSWHTLGTREVLIVHHTRCGAQSDDEDALRRELEDRTGAPLSGVELHTFADHRAALRDDIARVAGSPHVPEGLVVRGAIHDVDTGIVHPFDGERK